MLAFWFAVLSLCGSVAIQAQTSTSNSPPPPIPTTLSEPLWQTLYPLIMGLPTKFQGFKDNLTVQVDSLQSTMQQLQQDNESLTESLLESMQAVETLKKQSAQLQTDLDASIASTTQIKADLQKAQVDAKALEAQAGILKIGCIAFGVALGGVAVYEGGHALKIW